MIWLVVIVGKCIVGACVDFDGTDAYVTYGDVTWLDGLISC